MPRVSIVLPARDAVATIERAVESCLEQRYRDFELIVVDDGSRDGTSEKLERFADLPEVIVLSLEASLGVVGALQVGMTEASGDLIARMDADDWSHPERLQKQVEALDENPDWGVCACLVKLESPLGEGMQRYVDWVNGLQTPEDVRRERFIESPVIQPCVVMRREAYESVGGYRDFAWGEDYDLWLRMLDAGLSIGTVPEVLFHWLDREDCLTRTDGRYSQDSFLQAKAHYLARLSKVKEKGVVLGGAGSIGKTLARYLQAEGVTVHAFYEVHPRRVGNVIAGVPVLDMQQAEEHESEAVLLGAAGVTGARQRMRDWAGSLGYEEGRDFYCVC